MKQMNKDMKKLILWITCWVCFPVPATRAWNVPVEYLNLGNDIFVDTNKKVANWLLFFVNIIFILKI